MARAEFKLDLNGLDVLGKRFTSPVLIKKLENIAAEKGVAALVAQAIADNFAQEGPGWAPLKGATIRNSLSKSMAKRLTRAAGLNAAVKMGATKKDRNGNIRVDATKLKGKRKEYYARMDQEIEAMERRDRAATTPSGRQALGSRQILKRTGLLTKTVTTPGYSGSSQSEDGKTQSGSNIYRVEGTNLIWGTNLVYAATHQYGDPTRNIPKREFLVIRDQWKARLYAYILKLMVQAMNDILKGNL